MAIAISLGIIGGFAFILVVVLGTILCISKRRERRQSEGRMEDGTNALPATEKSTWLDLGSTPSRTNSREPLQIKITTTLEDRSSFRAEDLPTIQKKWTKRAPVPRWSSLSAPSTPRSLASFVNALKSPMTPRGSVGGPAKSPPKASKLFISTPNQENPQVVGNQYVRP